MKQIVAKSSSNRKALLIFKLVLVALISTWLCFEAPQHVVIFTSLGLFFSITLILVPRETTLILDDEKLRVIKHSYFRLRSKSFDYLITELKGVEFSGRKSQFEKGIGLHNLTVEVIAPSIDSKIQIELADNSTHSFPCFAEKSSLKKLFKELNEKLPITK